MLIKFLTAIQSVCMYVPWCNTSGTNGTLIVSSGNNYSLLDYLCQCIVRVLVLGCFVKLHVPITPLLVKKL